MEKKKAKDKRSKVSLRIKGFVVAKFIVKMQQLIAAGGTRPSEDATPTLGNMQPSLPSTSV